ncbi:NEL-type E3 ubiquitin ligase domain-containing protein [Pseudomonas atagonensis]|uniref:NEL-type E3 ubiquitin ligase domain-containing protein n=1 Tax=Pseudomonas atagonensis TaxID=2609964 RepID=UPI00140B147C|nr:NEL-type E3 ubiquitin ligase domain-containing protein [Pseudomonas atagonensis]
MSETVAARDKGLHHHFIKKKIRQRIRHLTPANLQQLGCARTPGGLAEDAMPDWFAELNRFQRQIIRDSQARSRTSNTALATTLKGLKGVTEFAQPLLEEALEKKFGLKVDTTKTWWYTLLLGDTLITDQTLLQLALRNFEDGQTFDEAELIAEQGEPAPLIRESHELYGCYYPKSGRSTWYRIKKLPIKPADFAALCRELDIGKRYQEHLATIFDAADRATTVKTQTIAAWKDSLRVQAHVARLKSLLSPTAHLALLGILNGEKSPTLDGEPVTFSQLHVLGSPASEMFVIGARRRRNKKVDFGWTNPGVNLFDILTYKDSRIIVCMPGDSVAPIKEYPSLRDFEKDLALRLRSRHYQRSFLRLIPHGDAGKFLGKIEPALQTLEWNPDAPHREKTLFGHYDGIYEQVYRDEPELNLSETFFDGDLFNELYKRHQQRLKETSAQLAVPTATVDHDAWYERLTHYAEWGLNILNVAAFFVPGLGEVMMAVMAVQLSTDVYHGVSAWSVGDTDLAWNYLSSVATNVAVMTALGAVASKVPKTFSMPLVDGMVKVKLPFGDEQLWRPGLSPYQSTTILPAGLKPNALGQYFFEGKTFICIEDQLYEKTFDAAAKKWRLKHPSDSNAYHPVLEHNGQGAWRHSFEPVASWNRATLMRRLGHVTEGLNVTELAQIADISGIDDIALRKLHIDRQPMPSALTDVLRQYRLDRQLVAVEIDVATAPTAEASELQRIFPSLSNEALRDVLSNASAEERLSISQKGKLPVSFLLKGRARARLARLNNALAGMRLQSVASLDSRRLALRALQELPGWPRTLRLEIRRHDTAGKLLASIGPESAGEVRYLVTESAGHVQADQFLAFDSAGHSLNDVSRAGDNFYASIMHALPEEARLSLGVPDVEHANQLQEKLAAFATGHRQSMFEVLIPEAKRHFRAPKKLASGQIGYALSGRAGGAIANQQLIARVTAVYPDLSDEIAEGMVNQLLLDGRTEAQIYHLLNVRLREYEALSMQLDQWSGHGGLRIEREPVAQAIREAWRTGGPVDAPASAHLDLSSAGDLPELNAHFPHVRSLELSVTGVLSQTRAAFVRQFPKVCSLQLSAWEGVPRDRLVEALKGLTTINELHLMGRLGVEFSETAQSVVDVMPQLQRLQLRGFATRLDVSRLPALRWLALSGTTDVWPKGVFELAQLRWLDLSHSNINTLPAELYTGHDSLWPGLKVSWSKLEQDQFIKAYEYVQTHPAHLLDAEHMLDRYAQDTLQGAMASGGELSASALRKLKAEGLSGRALLDHINGVREDAQALQQHLTAWQERSALVNGRQVNPRARLAAAREIRGCWRGGLRQRYGEVQRASDLAPQPGPSTAPPRLAMALLDSSTLDLWGEPLGDLPELPTLSTIGFNHVTRLNLPEVMASADGFNRFLQHFTEVRALDLSRNQLLDIPSSLDTLKQLCELTLHHNYLMINSSMQARLNGLSSLELLDLRYNRVQSLDVSLLLGLKTLRLGHTAIEAWPRGVLALPDLVQLELNNTVITSIPQAALSWHDSLWVDMSGCRLSQEARDNLLASSNSVAPMGISRADLRDGITIGGPAYFPPLISQHPELLLPLPVVPANDLAQLTAQARLQRLDPELDFAEAIRAVDALSASRGAGALFAQMAVWDEQYQALTQTLNDWISAPPFQLRDLSTPLWVSGMERRRAADRILRCWRENLRGALPVQGASGGYTLDLLDTPLGNLPALTGDFAHVGELKLNKIFLNESGLDAFIQPFAGIHSLELRDNLLTYLPESVTTLRNLKRLSVCRNRLSASPRLQGQLAALNQLETLDLSQNWLERVDISALTKLESLDLHDNRLVAWPEGLFDLPSLRSLDLRDNMIESIPAALLTEQYRPLRNGTNLANNDHLEGESLLLLRDHAQDGEDILGWPVADLDDALDSYDSDSDLGSDASSMSDESIDLDQVTGAEARERWIDPDANDADELTRIWDNFEQTPHCEAFFNLLQQMERTKDFTIARSDLIRRVHQVLRVANSDAELRDTVFAMAQSPQTCGDGRILLFSDIEVKVFEFETIKTTPANQQDSVLFKLARNLFRLGRIEKIANRDVLQRQAQGGRPDPAEVRLAYRIGLGERLQLPAQPKDMLYSGNVSQPTLDAAYAEVIQAEQTADFMDDLVGRKYWADQLKRKYAERFVALKQQQSAVQDALEDRYPAINDAYLAEVGALEVTFKTEETRLLIELTEIEQLQFNR